MPYYADLNPKGSLGKDWAADEEGRARAVSRLLALRQALATDAAKTGDGAYRDRTGDLRLAKLRRVFSVCRVVPLKWPLKPMKLWRDALIRHAAAPFGRAMLAERLQTFGGATTVLVVEDGLENRFGLLGPTRVQIPPPPLTTPNLTAGGRIRREIAV